jgi:hypothetical protein
LGFASVGASIVAGNRAQTLGDIAGDIVTPGDNVFGDGTGALGTLTDLRGTTAAPLDARQGALQHEGIQWFHPPVPGSPVIDLSLTAFSASDQRA